MSGTPGDAATLRSPEAVRGAPAWRGDRLRAGGTEVARFTVGPDDRGAPGVLLLHGLGHWTQAAWDRLVPLLDSGLRIVSIDLPGFGASARPDVAYGLPFFQAVIADVVRASFDGPVGLVGNSLGGLIAAAFAAAEPERVGVLALVAPAGFLDVAPWLVRLLGSPVPTALFQLPPTAGFVRRTLRDAYHDPGRNLDPRLVEHGIRLARAPLLRRAFARVYSGAMQELRDLPVLHARLARYTGPVLVAWGRHDRYIPVRALENARRTYPHARTLVLEQSGHVPMNEEPGALAAALRDLLR